MALRANSEPDLERGVFLLPNGNANQAVSPTSSTGSDRPEETISNEDETLSTSRDTESSSATPSKPLLVKRSSVIQHNGGHNGFSKINPHCKAKYDLDSKRKRKWAFWKGKEHLCCLFGTVTFLLGAIFICVSLILLINGLTQNVPCASALRDQDSTISSPLENSSHQQFKTSISSSTTTVSTTTFNYGKLVNIAVGLEHHAYQSSTYDDGQHQYSAHKALDGRANYTLGGGSCSLTEAQLKPFWWLDMTTYKLVKRIRMFKPTDCCDDALTDFEIRIGQQEELSTNALCKHFPGTNLGEVVEVVCERQIYGRYLSIQLLGSDGVVRQLALCEVQVYGH